MSYKTFLRAARDWEEFAKNQKTVVERGLSEEQAREACYRFNTDRSWAQIKAGLKMEYTTE